MNKVRGGFQKVAVGIGALLIAGVSGVWPSRGNGKAPARVAATKVESAAQPQLAASYAKLPLSFELNAGQTDAQVKFLSRGRGYALFLTGNEAVLSLQRPSHPDTRKDAKAPLPVLPGLLDRPQDRMPAPQAGPPAAFRMSLIAANQAAAVTGVDELPGKSNYFIGNDPAKWRTNVPTYAKVKYQNVYPGIDLVYYGNQQQLEYDFVVAPGADPKAISLRVGTMSPGGNRLQIDPTGDLVIQAGEDQLRVHKPVVYQVEEAAKQLLDAHFLLRGDDQATFEVAAYDQRKPLVIDPVLTYSTYLGGSGGDSGYGIAVDSSGSVYVAGSTGSTDFPTASPLHGSISGGADAFVSKLKPDGSALVYSTYLGGSSDDVGYGIAVDSSGRAYVTGLTWSTDFPTASALHGSNSGANDAFVTKLNPDGSALVYSTYLGGSSYDQGSAIAVDSLGSAYLTGTTQSTNFPTASPLYGSFGGGADAFVAKLKPDGSALVYSTYLGGSGADLGNAIAVDPSGAAYVTGFTFSTNFPTASPLYASNSGSGDAFVAKLKPDGSALVYSTYLGGGDTDRGQGIAVDSSGSAYVTGYTTSTNFPTASPLYGSSSGNGDAFVAKLKPDGSALVYSTYVGGSGGDGGSGIAVDSFGSAYVAGTTESTNFPTASPLYGSNGGYSDAFVAKLKPGGSALVYSTYLGGSYLDAGQAIALDSSGSAYVTGYTTSTNFPTASPLYGSFGGGLYDAFVAKLTSDTTPPVIVPQITGTLGNNGWYRSNVMVTWSVTDPESGIASSSGCTTTNLTADTAGVTLTCSATNGAGLPASDSVNIKIDQTPPIISGVPAPGCTLWPPDGTFIQVATVTASDALSGLAAGFSVNGTSNQPLPPTDPRYPEIVITPTASGGFSVQLRADRTATSSDRIYTLNATATDLAGNPAIVTATCTVPHDQGN